MATLQTGAADGSVRLFSEQQTRLTWQQNSGSVFWIIYCALKDSTQHFLINVTRIFSEETNKEQTQLAGFPWWFQTMTQTLATRSNKTYIVKFQQDQKINYNLPTKMRTVIMTKEAEHEAFCSGLINLRSCWDRSSALSRRFQLPLNSSVRQSTAVSCYTLATQLPSKYDIESNSLRF